MRPGEAQPGVQEAAGRLARALRCCRSRCRSDHCRSLRVRHSKQPDPPRRVSKRPWSEGQGHLWRLREDIVEPRRRREARAQAASAKHEHIHCRTLDSTGFPGSPHGHYQGDGPVLRVIRAAEAEAKEEEALEEEAQDTSPDAVREANLANRKPPRVRAGVPVLPLLEIFAPLTPLVFQGVRTGVSVLQRRCGRVTLLVSARPCARRSFDSEAASSVRVLHYRRLTRPAAVVPAFRQTQLPGVRR